MKKKVYIVGAGPGDYGLITVKAIECIKNADVIVYDRLVNPDFLSMKKDDCEVIYVGKKSSNHIVPQDEINEILINKSKEDKVVVRLKGGDPYVFGRGGEEAETLFDADIDFEVIPGVTSAIGGLCYAGIPVTHRDFSSSFHVVTGHSKKDDNLEINWESLASEKGTLIFLMGIGNIKQIVNKLVDNGKDANTPVAFVSWATKYNQKTIISTLKDAYNCVIENDIKAPSIFVVGDVVKLSEKLCFFEKKALFGKTVAITRTRNSSSKLKQKLEKLGARVIEIPTIKLSFIDSSEKILLDKIKDIEKYKYIVFTSHNSVKFFFNAIKSHKIDIRKLNCVKICSIGDATTREIEKNFIYPDIVTTEFNANSLSDKISFYEPGKVLFPCSKIAGDTIERELTKYGFYVDRIELYTNNVNYEIKDNIIDILCNEKIDYITFTSSSTFTSLLELIGKENLNLIKKMNIISIGDITSKTILSNIDKNTVYQSKEASIDSIIEKILELESKI